MYISYRPRNSASKDPILKKKMQKQEYVGYDIRFFIRVLFGISEN